MASDTWIPATGETDLSHEHKELTSSSGSEKNNNQSSGSDCGQWSTDVEGENERINAIRESIDKQAREYRPVPDMTYEDLLFNQSDFSNVTDDEDEVAGRKSD